MKDLTTVGNQPSAKHCPNAPFDDEQVPGSPERHGLDIGAREQQCLPKDVLKPAELDQQHISLIIRSIPGGTGNIQHLYPLSVLQEGMLFHRLLDEQSDTYVLSTLLELESRAQVERLTRALEAVIHRHDALRTLVLWEGLPRPIQIVQHHAMLPVEQIELDDSRDALEQLKDRMRPGHQKFNLRKAPLMRLQIAGHPRSGHCYALLVVHHVICDHQSLRTVIAEALSFLDGRELELPPGRSYHAYITEALAHGASDESELFFRGRLADVVEPTVPYGLIDVHGNGDRIEEDQQSLGAALAGRIRAQAHRLGVTSARLIHAGWAVLVAKASGRDDVVFGTVLSTAERGIASEQHMIGMTVNTLPLRLKIRDVTVKQLISQTHQELRELVRHKHAALTLAQGCSGVSASMPLFAAILNYRHSEVSVHAAGSAGGVRVLSRGEAWSNYPIALTVDDLGHDFHLTAQVDRSTGAQRVIGHFRAAMASLMDALEHAPESAASRLSVLPSTELDQVLRKFNATQMPVTLDRSILNLFVRQAARLPDVVAISCGERKVTYAELDRRSNQMARALLGRGVRPDDRVAVCLERSPEMVISLLGVLKAGAAYVPLDVTYPADRLVYMIEDSRPMVVVTKKRWKEILPEKGDAFMTLDDCKEVERSSDAPLSDVDVALLAEHLAYLIYTSGSTGAPKGVMVEHRNLMNLVRWHCTAFGVTEGCRCSSLAAVGFDAAVWEIWPVLCAGATLVLPPMDVVCDLERMLAWWRSEPLDISFLPTPIAEFAFSRDIYNPRLRTLLVGGDRLRRLPTRVSFSLINNYGPTEATVVATSGRIAQGEGVLHIGHPIANTQIYILDEDLNAVPVGIAGEAYIAGASVARGYLNRAHLTAERFVPDPFSVDHGERMYKTGDIARWRSDGTIEYLGRNDNQVKLRGFRIELGEIEAQLARHPRLGDAVVVLREDARSEKFLVAYVTRRDDSELDLEGLREYIKTMLPEYMIPRAFVALDSIPLTVNGKVDLRALPEPTLMDYGSQAYEAPQGEVEEILAGIWQSLLGIARVGRHDNFFELGGHSLLILQMLERLHRVGLATDVRHVFESPKLTNLAATLMLESSRHLEIPPNVIPPRCEQITPDMLPLIKLNREQISLIERAVPDGAENIQDIYPLAPLQEGILFHHLLNDLGGDTYVVPTLLMVESKQQLGELIEALQAVIDRHDILRTAVLWEHLPQPVQVVYRHAELPVAEVALDAGREAISQVQEWIRPDRQRVDLRQAPLMRLKIAEDIQNGRWYVLLQLHHVTVDHVTWEVLLGEVVAHIQSRSQQLPKPVPYREHVARAVAYGRSPEIETFFRSKLGDIHDPTAPFGLTDVHGDGSHVIEAHEVLDRALAKRVRIQARTAGCSAATLFHASWALVVAGTSGREDVVFGTVLLGRLQGGGTADSQRMLGMFINTLPIRIRLAGAKARELVDQTQRELVQLLAHEQASLAVAQHCSAMAGSGPLFTTLLNYRHSVRSLDAEWSSAKGIQALGFQERTNYPIAVAVDDLGDGFTLHAQTDRRIEPQRITAYLRAAVFGLVEALEREPNTAALAIPILTKQERAEILGLCIGRQVSYPSQQLIQELFEEQVLRKPQAVAVVYADRLMTYEDLNDRANQLAHYLIARGLGASELVGICVERSCDMIVGLIGVLKAGGAYLPLDPDNPPERLGYMVEDAKPRIVITQEALRRRLTGIRADVIAIDARWHEIARYPTNNLAVKSLGLRASNLAYAIYTSGSTGRPKGVLIEHRHVVNLWYGLKQAYGLSTACERVALNASINFDASVQQFVQLLSGRTIYLLPSECRRDASLMLAFLDHNRIDSIDCTPSQLDVWLSAGLMSSGRHRLGMVLVGGEAIDPKLWATLAQCSGTNFFNVYGPTECTVDATIAHLNGEGAMAPNIGSPMGNRRIYILNSLSRCVPVGAPGEIYIGGAGVASGYLHRPELTAERFVPDLFANDPGARMYMSGDLGRWRADGTIEYLGRNDGQVKIRGFRIELGEIEAHLARQPGVSGAVVIMREDVPGEKRLVAYLSRDSSGVSSTMQVEDLRTHLQSALPEYMVPSAFVILDGLPLTLSGKLDVRALPVPDLMSYTSRSYEAPEGEVQQSLAAIWRDLLGLTKVGSQDNFFEIGGHSLLALKSLLEINRRFGSNLRIADLYKYPTLRDLAARIGGLTTDEELVDLAKEAVLPGDIVVPPRLRDGSTTGVMLTGATGFVGRFLLVQLLQDTTATVYCVVRANSRQKAMTRLKAILCKWDLWREEFERRIIAIPGDLRLHRFGVDDLTYKTLCRHVDVIYHCATSMNHLETYAMAKPVNVDAAVELLRIAAQERPKTINYISTLSVFSHATTAASRSVDEFAWIDGEKHLASRGYAASKWVGEKIFMLARDRGLPCNIFRVGLVFADTRQGRYDELQNIYRVFKSCLLCGYAIRDYRLGMALTPVDYVARAIVYLGNQSNGVSDNFHISSVRHISQGVFERCNDVTGRKLDLLPYYDWLCHVRQLHREGTSLPVVPLVEYAFSMDEPTFYEHLKQADASNLKFDCTRTQSKLERAGIVESGVDDHLLNVFVERMCARDTELRAASGRSQSPGRVGVC